MDQHVKSGDPDHFYVFITSSSNIKETLKYIVEGTICWETIISMKMKKHSGKN